MSLRRRPEDEPAQLTGHDEEFVKEKQNGMAASHSGRHTVTGVGS